MGNKYQKVWTVDDDDVYILAQIVFMYGLFHKYQHMWCYLHSKWKWIMCGLLCNICRSVVIKGVFTWIYSGIVASMLTTNPRCALKIWETLSPKYDKSLITQINTDSHNRYLQNRALHHILLLLLRLWSQTWIEYFLHIFMWVNVNLYVEWGQKYATIVYFIVIIFTTFALQFMNGSGKAYNGDLT